MISRTIYIPVTHTRASEYVTPQNNYQYVELIQEWYKSLSGEEKITVDFLINEIRDKISQRNHRAGMGEGGALEVLVKLYLWLSKHQMEVKVDENS